MTRKVTTCDICGNEFTNPKSVILAVPGAVNKYEYEYEYDAHGIKRYFIRKRKMDICEHCMKKFTIWLKEQESVQ